MGIIEKPGCSPVEFCLSQQICLYGIYFMLPSIQVYKDAIGKSGLIWD